MTGRSACPECGTILRIRDRSFVGRKVHCPACKVSLQIESTDNNGNYVTRKLAPTEADDSKIHRTASKTILEKNNETTSKRRSSVERFLSSPLTAAWLLAIAISVLVAVLALGPKFHYARARTNVSQLEAVSKQEPQPVIESPAVVMDPVHEDPQVENAVTEDVDQSLPVSALEPENMEGPLPVPSPKKEEVPEPPPVKLNIPAKLAQKITRYTQPKVRRRDLLEVLREQLGVPIEFDPEQLGEAKLDETVSFDLADTTIGDVIKAVADSGQWEITIEETGIRLVPKRDSVTP